MSARALAIRVLARVEATDAFLNVVLDTVLDEAGLADVRDAALVTELCYGATRRRMALDACILTHSDRKLSALEDRVLAALRIGVYQLRYMRVPMHAAVGDTVQALKAHALARATGFVNAILRKVSAMTDVPMPEGADEWQRLAVLESHPEWLVRRWLAQFGPDQTRALLAANNEAPALVVRVNTTKTTREALLEELNGMGVRAEATQFSPLGLRIASPGRVDALFGFSEGLWQVQDEAAQLVGELVQVKKGMKVLDVCAAPGGKTCHLAQTAEVTAFDLHANKLPKIEAEARRLGLSERVQTRKVDASQPLPAGQYDAVVVDAPCSGLGTLRRHPELRYRRKETDFEALVKMQRAILTNAKEAVAPGGVLVYAVCSLDPSEGLEQVEWFLEKNPDFTLAPPEALSAWPHLGGALRTLPGPEGLDGFFGARMVKKA